MWIATVDVLLMHCLEWTSHVSVHAHLKVSIISPLFRFLSLLLPLPSSPPPSLSIFPSPFTPLSLALFPFRLSPSLSQSLSLSPSLSFVEMYTFLIVPWDFCSL